jgi:hypothetical protein
MIEIDLVETQELLVLRNLRRRSIGKTSERDVNVVSVTRHLNHQPAEVP